jgi:hypothetical protein
VILDDDEKIYRKEVTQESCEEIHHSAFAALVGEGGH